MTTCKICGNPIQRRNAIGICQQNPACRAAYRAKKWPPAPRQAPPTVPCSNCGILTTSKWGVCARKLTGCHAVQQHLRVAAGRIPQRESNLPCLVCRGPLKVGTRTYVCYRNPKCARVHKRMSVLLTNLKVNEHAS